MRRSGVASGFPPPRLPPLRPPRVTSPPPPLLAAATAARAASRCSAGDCGGWCEAAPRGPAPAEGAEAALPAPDPPLSPESRRAAAEVAATSWVRRPIGGRAADGFGPPATAAPLPPPA
eukprot:611272-Prorocentrum_minimum.AAC.2